MQQIQTDVLQLTGKLLLKNNNSLCLHRYDISKSSNSFALFHYRSNSQAGFQVLLTDLAYFLEVELWQGVEPVGQLSEVEKLHLKPGPETDRGGKLREIKQRQGDERECR